MTLNFLPDRPRPMLRRRRFLPVGNGYAHMMRGNIAEVVRWFSVRTLGFNSGFYKLDGDRIWHFCVRGRRIW